MQQQSGIEQFSYMWDGSEDWALLQGHETRIKLVVTFASGRPNISELIALRKLEPDYYANMQPAQFRALVGDSGQFEMGSFDSFSGHQLWREAKNLGLIVERVDIPLNVIGFLDRTRNMIPIFEDGDMASQIAEKND